MRTLPRLEDYFGEFQAALRALGAGDIVPIMLLASGCGWLSRDLEIYDKGWMLDEDRLAVEGAISRVVNVTDRIHRLGHDELARTGRIWKGFQPVDRVMAKRHLIVQIVLELITFLECISDEDRDRGQLAATNIRRSLRYFEESGSLGGFDYDFGGKGIFDWAWNPTNEERITMIIERYSNLLKT
jgi:hypothetical protein